MTVASKVASFIIDQASLSEGLKLVSVCSSSQVMQVLSFVHMRFIDGQVILSASNAEVEIQTAVRLLQQSEQDFAITVPCRKLMDILRFADKEASVIFNAQGMQLNVEIGNSSYKVNTLEEAQFPFFKPAEVTQFLEVSDSEICALIKRTAFAMAHQDVRYFLNGMLLEFNGSELKTVATDGHRLAVNSIETQSDLAPFRAIVPRKTIQELTRLLSGSDATIKLLVTNDFIEVHHDTFHLKSNLIDAQYPDYQKLIPRSSEESALIETSALRHALNRVNILANEKFRGVRMHFKVENQLTLEANNLDKEVAVENIAVLEGPVDITIAFNIGYLADILAVTESDRVQLQMSGAQTGTLIQEEGGEMNSLFVVMPLTL